MKKLIAILFTALASLSAVADIATDHAVEKNPSLGGKPKTLNPEILAKTPNQTPTGKNPGVGKKPGTLKPEEVRKRPGMVNQMFEIFLGNDESKTSFEAADAIEKVSAKIHQAAQSWGNAPKNQELAKKHYQETMAELIALSGKFCGGSVGKGVTEPVEESPKKSTALKGLFETAK
jgi:hypothetical protein